LSIQNVDATDSIDKIAYARLSPAKALPESPSAAPIRTAGLSLGLPIPLEERLKLLLAPESN
jgi:hypothetical protein